VDENALSHTIIGAAIEVHRVLGPGLLESVYEESLALELQAQGLTVDRQREVTLRHKGTPLRNVLRLDMLVNELVIVEVKAVERLLAVHEAQVSSYLRLTDKRLGLLINFNTAVLKHSIRRIVNQL
jgi:GxxExxY protein